MHHNEFTFPQILEGRQHRANSRYRRDHRDRMSGDLRCDFHSEAVVGMNAQQGCVRAYQVQDGR
jgi:hypothetical protein